MYLVLSADLSHSPCKYLTIGYRRELPTRHGLSICAPAWKMKLSFHDPTFRPMPQKVDAIKFYQLPAASGSKRLYMSKSKKENQEGRGGNKSTKHITQL